jgi:long-subunit acyl-CoA synthetase (AMP-forming)
MEYYGYGVLQTGAVTVPIYPTISENDYEYILNHSEAIYCFVSDKELAKINLIKDKVPHLKEVLVLIQLQIVKLGEARFRADQSSKSKRG